MAIDVGPIPDPSPILAAGEKLGSYRIESLIGKGGMGEVYLARDERLQRPVAIKRIRRDRSLDGEHRERFRREALAVAQVSHPAIVQVYEWLETPFGPCLVMEWISGRNLAEVIAAGELDLRRILRLACEIAEGLAEAHAKGFLHRDLKPENVLVTASGHAKIVDFGLVAPLAAAGRRGGNSVDPLGSGGRHGSHHVAGAGRRRPTSTIARISFRSAASSTRCSPAARPSAARPGSTPCRRSCARTPRRSAGPICRRRWSSWSTACWPRIGRSGRPMPRRCTGALEAILLGPEARRPAGDPCCRRAAARRATDRRHRRLVGGKARSTSKRRCAPSCGVVPLGRGAQILRLGGHRLFRGDGAQPAPAAPAGLPARRPRGGEGRRVPRPLRAAGRCRRLRARPPAWRSRSWPRPPGSRWPPARWFISAR